MYLRDAHPAHVSAKLGSVIRLNVVGEKTWVSKTVMLDDGAVWYRVEMTKMKKKTNL